MADANADVFRPYAPRAVPTIDESPMPPQTRYRWSWEQKAEPVDVTDQWTGRRPDERIGGVNLFWAVDSNRSMQKGQDYRYFNLPGNSKIVWGNVVRTSVMDSVFQSNNGKPIYLIPFCHLGECSDPNRAAPRFLVYEYSSAYADRPQYRGWYAMPWNDRLRICSFTAHGRDENDDGECYIAPDALQEPFSAARALQNFDLIKRQYYAGLSAYEARHPQPEFRPECMPYTVIPDPEANPIGHLEWPCMGIFSFFGG